MVVNTIEWHDYVVALYIDVYSVLLDIFIFEVHSS